MRQRLTSDPRHGHAREARIFITISLAALLVFTVPAGATASAWAPNSPYTVGALVTYQGQTYRCLQAHTSQLGWEPATTPALWELVNAGPTGALVFLPFVSRSIASTPPPTATRTPNPTPTRTPTAGPSPTQPPGGGWPARVFAPYVDVTLWPTFSLTQTANALGVKFYTLAFIVDSGNCNAAWGGVIPLDQNFMLTDITGLRGLGGDVIISFGGANGVELAQGCTSVSGLQTQYQAVIDRYHVTRLDFDVEGAALAQPASVTRRNQAIAALQAAAQSRGQPLNVSFTLPVLPTGLTQDGVNLLQNAIDNGVQISVANIMAMDYGGPGVADPYQMGQNAIDAANSLFTQLKSLYPGRTDAQIWAMIGVTPMIGLNDVVPEVFTLADAQLLLTFAQQKNLARLAMWSATRDQQCPGAPSVSPTCSGITQAPWDFSNRFKQFTP